MFNVTRKRSDPSVQQSNCITKDKPKFVRCVSIARLFGNAYSTHQHMSRQKTDTNTKCKSGLLFKNRTGHVAATNKLKIERFKNRSESQIDQSNGVDCTDFCKTDNKNVTLAAAAAAAAANSASANDAATATAAAVDEKKLPIEDFCDEKDLSARAFRTISKGLGLIWRRSYSVEISTPDPEYKVFYLGNVLTGWAKGDNCIEKPLATLWRNYTQINKPDVAMRILVCSSGLRATTRQHGLTEYWSNRITYCCSPKNYPRVFCWIYRHEGRKLKHELRCHAVLCPKEAIAEEICKTLKENLTQALKEFKRDKINRQNARLSLVNSLYENPSMPRRKILLSVGANNYRPPMERSKSAPKLMAIEEAVGEEEEICSMPSFKKSQSHIPYSNVDLFTTTTTNTNSSTTNFGTFDRKYCKRNRSNQAMTRRNSSFEQSKSRCPEIENNRKISDGCIDVGRKLDSQLSVAKDSSFDDDDDFNNLLMTNDYDMKSSLSGEILSYFDTKLNKSSSPTTDTETETSLSLPEIDSHPAGATGTGCHNQINQSLTLNTVSNVMTPFDFDSFNSEEVNFCSIGTESTVFNQNEVLNSLVAQSKDVDDDFPSMKMDSSSLDNCTKMHEANSVFLNSNGNAIVPFVMDSDEGSITSGCETSSIITTAHMDELIRSEREIDAITLTLSRLPLKHTVSNLERVTESDHQNGSNGDAADDDDDQSNAMRTNGSSNNEEDSEFSDESGFDENNSGKSNNFRNKTVLKGESAATTMTTMAAKTSITTNCNADANNNIKQHTFNSNTIKSVGRLRINIPKNAKSIDI